MWFELAIIALFAYALQDLLFKVADEIKADSEITVLAFFFFGGVFALILAFYTKEKMINSLMVFGFAALQASFFLISNLLKLASLKKISSLVAFPIFNMYAPIIVFLGVFYLGEKLNIIQIIGIALFTIAILLLIKAEHFRINQGILFAFLAMIALAISSFIVKLAAEKVTPFFFIAFSYLFAVFPSYLIEKTSKGKGSKQKALKIGFFLAVINLFGFYSLISALREGPASIIYPIVSLALLGSVVLSKIIYHEKLTLSRGIAIILAVIGVVLLRISL